MISQRVQNTAEPPLVELGLLASQTKGCISLGQGVPYYSLEKKLIEEFYQLLGDKPYHRYSSDPGIITLRQLLAEKLQLENKIDCDHDQITVTNGANQAFVNTILTLTDPGDKVGLISPYYFNHKMACSLLNLEVIEIDLHSNYSLSYENLEKAIRDGIKVLVVVNPGNPTGGIFSKEDMKTIADIIDDLDIWIISDETYEYFIYGDQPHISCGSFEGLEDRTITIGSFSKTYGIPGWRLGYYQGPQEFIRQAMKIQDTSTICAPSISQYLGEFLLNRRKQIIPGFYQLMRTNQSLAKDLLAEIKWLENENGSGAYYLFPKQTTGKSTEKLVRQLILENKVAVVPGIGFGKSFADYIRISFANVIEDDLQTAFSRLKSL